MMGRFLFRLSIFLVVPLAAAAGAFYVLRQAFISPIDPASTKTVLLEVAPGKSFRQISEQLESLGLIRHWWSVSLLARVLKFDTRISSGEYEIKASMSPRQILEKLRSGEIYKRVVLVREGTSVFDIGKIVEDAGLVGASEFTRAVQDSSLLLIANLAKVKSFEGYLFPNTYYFSRPIVAKDIIWKMLEEGDHRWLPEFTDRAVQLNMSRHDVLTLASIIEKESGNAEEQPLVSSVFHNRLNQGMRLQSDPTVIYGLQGFNGNLTKADLANPHPYNTYVNFGLPPGPICNPGETAIKAALYPKETTYLFFVGNGQGSHVFSTTLQEHNEAVAKYQLGRGD